MLYLLAVNIKLYHVSFNMRPYAFNLKYQPVDSTA